MRNVNNIKARLITSPQGQKKKEKIQTSRGNTNHKNIAQDIWIKRNQDTPDKSIIKILTREDHIVVLKI